MLKRFLIIARFIVGIVFIFSGFVKGIDPWGFNYKLTDYIHSLNLNWMQPLTFPGAFILPLLEFLIGDRISKRNFCENGCKTGFAVYDHFHSSYIIHCD